MVQNREIVSALGATSVFGKERGSDLVNLGYHFLEQHFLVVVVIASGEEDTLQA